MSHRKLSEREEQRMSEIYEEEISEYIPYIDDELMKLGLIIWVNEDKMTDVRCNPKSQNNKTYILEHPFIVL